MTAGRSFAACFGREPAVTARAPGRVNLIGEHTDYSEGFVLPIATPFNTDVQLAPRDDDEVHVMTTAVGLRTAMRYFIGRESLTHSWLDYVQGVTVALRAVGVQVRGFDATISSTIPVGAGLSSSAALEISLLRALRIAFRLDIDDMAMARIGRAAGTDFVGAPVGIMDQMAASFADVAVALFLDTRSMGYERIPLPAAAELVVIHSGVVHAHSSGDYAVRRSETERAAQLLGVAALRDVGLDRLGDVARLPIPLDRRARHVVTENGRVLEAAEALRHGELGRLGHIIALSHASMRDDFEVSVAAVDRVVELACAQEGVYGARLTGGGFGGCVVALARAGAGVSIGRSLTPQLTGGARVLLPALRSP